MSKHTFIVRIESRTDLPDMPVDVKLVSWILTKDSLVGVISVDEVQESPKAYEKEPF
jgi:hypothetical protein